MKKTIVTILSVLYLSSTNGMTVHLHYCMDKMINWSLLNSEGDQCGKCGMQKDGGCCKDESKIVKNDSDQQATAFSVQLIKVITAAELPELFGSIRDYLNTPAKDILLVHSPQHCGDHPIFILNCVFRL